MGRRLEPEIGNKERPRSSAKNSARETQGKKFGQACLTSRTFVHCGKEKRGGRESRSNAFVRETRGFSVRRTCPPSFLITELARIFVSRLVGWSKRFHLALFNAPVPTPSALARCSPEQPEVRDRRRTSGKGVPRGTPEERGRFRAFDPFRFGRPSHAFFAGWSPESEVALTHKFQERQGFPWRNREVDRKQGVVAAKLRPSLYSCDGKFAGTRLGARKVVMRGTGHSPRNYPDVINAAATNDDT